MSAHVRLFSMCLCKSKIMLRGHGGLHEGDKIYFWYAGKEVVPSLFAQFFRNGIISTG